MSASNGNSNNPSSLLRTQDKTPSSQVSLTNSLENEKVIDLSSQETAKIPQSTPSKMTSSSGSSKLGLRAKASLLAVTLGTLPVLGIGGLTYLLSSKTLEQKIISTETQRVESLQNKVNLFMRERFGDIQVMASLPIFADAKLRELTSQSEKDAVLVNIQKAYGIYDSIAVFDKNGNVLAQTPGTPLKNHLNRTYIQEALKINGAVISQPSLSTTEGSFNIYTASTIKDQTTGQTIGFIRTRMPVKYLDNILKNDRDQDSQYYLINKEGEIFIAPDGVYATQNRTDGKTVIDQKAIAADSIFPKLKQLPNQAKTSIITDQNTKTNQDVLLVVAPSTQSPGLPALNWRAVLATDTAKAFAFQRNLLSTLLLGTGLSALVTAAIALYLTNRFIRPLVQASKTVQKLGSGDLEARLNITGEDELAVLGTNIDLMAERIQALIQKQQGELKVTQTLGKISQVRTPEEQKRLLTRFLAEIQENLNVDRVVIYRFNPDWSGFVMNEAVKSPWPTALSEQIADPCIGQDLILAYQRGRIKATNDVEQSGFHPEHTQLMQRLKIKANLVTPIIQNGELFGLLVAHHCADIHFWQTEEINFLSKAANQLGLAMTGSLLEQVQSTADNERRQNENRQQELLALLSDIEGAAQGDLTVRAEITAGEIGIVADFFNAIVESLREIVQRVKNTAEEVHDSIEDKQQAINSLAGEALKQTEAIQKSVVFGEQMTFSSQKVANKARKAAQIARTASATAFTSGTMIDKTVANNLELRSTVAETAKKMKRLGESSQQISKVVRLINQMSLKTNLLAINASIEAARAGEEGRGFAIIAEEVGQLAAQSTTATKEIEQIVDAILAETNEVIKAMEVGTTQVVEESRLVEETKQSLQKILEISEQIDSLFQSISQETESQTETAQKITQLMQDISEISQQTANSSHQMSNALEKTVAIAQDLQASVSQFKVSE